MIPKMNSKDLSEILINSQNSISNIESNISMIKNDLTNKLSIIKNEQEFYMQELFNTKELLSSGSPKDLKNKIVYARETAVDGVYDSYGSVVHPKFVRTPNNVFNLITSIGPVFKDNANIYVNGVIDNTQKPMLMHDAISSKEVAFKEYDSANIKLEVEVNVGDLLGDTSFNMIELAPYLPGSFTINSIEVYKIQSYLLKSTVPDYSIVSSIDKVGACRIMLSDKLSLYKFVMNITVNYKNRNGKYPFGLRHLYFYNADFDPNSYIISKIEKSNFIDWVSEDVYIRNQLLKYESTCAAEGIKVYMSYDKDVLEYEILTSKGISENIIARNTKDLYIKMPLKCCIVSLEFDKIADR